MFGRAVFISIAVLLLLCYDLQLRLAFLFSPRRAIRTLDAFQQRGSLRLMRLARACLRLEVRVERPRVDLPLPSFLIVANHQSLLDIPVLACAFPQHRLRFVAKLELRRGLPALSFAIRRGEHALIDRRGGARSNVQELGRLAQSSRRAGACPVIFPEGTRSRTGEVLRFHSAGVRMILDRAPMPIVVVAMHGGYRVARLKDMRRRPRPMVYFCRVLSSHPPENCRRGALEVLDRARAEIIQQVEAWKHTET